ncbi:MAG TPA: anion transporter [Bryobacteraceae bacterium]|nr:anion transporter [Bryobacteraceae bacterium]
MPAILIFLGTYLVLAIGHMPGLRIDRTGAAIIGAALMVAANVLTIEEAYQAIHLDTIILLFGMMIVVANLRLSGFFALVSEWTVEHAHHPITLLAAISVVSAALSAFFVNDTVCLVMAPLVAEVLANLRRNPVPYLLAVAMASNIGSVATLTGNPQNMLIGSRSFSGISYTVFARALAPVAVVGVAVMMGVLLIVYRREFRRVERVHPEPRMIQVDRLLMLKALAISVGMVAFFFAGWPIAKVAIVAGALLLITRRVHPEKVYAQVDWGLLVMFAGLFIVIAGLEKSSFEGDLMRFADRAHLDSAAVMTSAAAILSNIVSNVPAVLVFKPFMAHLTNPTLGWLRLAMASTLAGNLTILGSVANLIVVERTRDSARIGFWEYARAGIPVGCITLAIGAWMLR